MWPRLYYTVLWLYVTVDIWLFHKANEIEDFYRAIAQRRGNH